MSQNENKIVAAIEREQVIDTLHYCRSKFQFIEANCKSISSARKEAAEGISAVNGTLQMIEPPRKAVERLEFAKKRGHEFSREDVETLLDLYKNKT